MLFPPRCTTGITHVTNRQVQTAGEASTFWQPCIDMMEFLADFCLYTYIATNKPIALPALYTLPNVVSQLPIEQTWHDFDTKYTNMKLENYFLYHGIFFNI